MARRPALTRRTIDILHSIVESYIETGDPVASRTISRRHGDRHGDALSAASIRNVMADLYDEGYLSQPHTSAGRIPTAKAFRSYVKNHVQSLGERRVLAPELQRLREELGHLATTEARIERSSRLLTHMTRSVSITAAIPTSAQILDQIELIGLADRRVLMIVITRDQMVRNRVVALDEATSSEELISIRNYINRNFAGWKLAEVHIELRRRLAEESAAYDDLLRKLTLLYANGLFEIDSSPEVHLEGTSYLVGLDLHLTREKMRELFSALEEKKRILHLLECFLEQPDGELAFQVGLADVHPSMGELSLIGVSIALPGGMSAKIAVLGPTRMNYEKVISAVLHMGQAFQNIPA
ncbi:MAG: heat-inducible transcriptional repressor HrcA [Acidobacteriota bacterium]|nr:heat-inducible transcriptional repressor HrcA [Acidobacteriota bacterium]